MDPQPLHRTLVTASFGVSVALLAAATILTLRLAPEHPFDAAAVATVTAIGIAALAFITRRALTAISHAERSKDAAEQQHRDQAATTSRLRGVWEKSPLSIMLFEPNDPDVPVKILDCNPRACEMHGYTQEELVGKSIDFIEVTPWAKENSAGWINQLRIEKRLEGMAQHRRKDGSVFDTEYFTSLIVVEGREVVIGMDRDATTNRTAERALRQSEERWQLAVAGSNEGVWDWELTSGRLWLSPRWKNILGYENDEIPNTPESWFERVHPDDSVAMQARLREHLEKRSELYECEYRMRHKDGSWRWILGRGKAHFDSSDKPQRMLGTQSDITDRKQIETELRRAKDAAEAADRAKSDFLAVMSHEIRTPMNGVIGFTNLLLDTNLSVEQRDWLLTIRSSGESLVTLINDILDFSKIESGHMDLDQHPVQIRRCVEEVLDLLWAKASEKKIELLHWIDDGAPEWIITDGTRLRQVLVNVVGNAIKFTQEGEVEVRVSPEPMGENGRARIAFAIRDTGGGIPPGRVHRLFKPFSQVDSSTTRKFGGTGLGLAISRRLVQLLGGEIELAYTSEKGSCFRFAIDAAPVVAPEGQAAPRAPTTLHVELGNRHAVIVDDNETNRRILSRQLSRWGLICHAFERPMDALAYLREQGEADVALLDMMMPDTHGVELASAITKLSPTKPLPLVLLSSVSREELRPFFPEHYFKVILCKPVRQSALLDALHTTLATEHQQASPGDVAATREIDHALGQRHPLRILVAEDNVVNQKLITRLLERLGYAPLLVDNGFACLEALRRGSYDVVLMDCQMPEMDGYETTQNIRAGGTGTRNKALRIIALTASAMVGDREKCVAAGMDSYLTKPIQTPDLVQTLESAPRLED